MNIKKLSNLQNEIINTFKTNNIIITGYPGVGKTTTGIFIAEKFYDKKILFLSLHENSKQIIENYLQQYNFKNVDTYTLENYNTIIQTSTKKINYDFIIIDEVEDFTQKQYSFFYNCISFLINTPNLCLIGDINQSCSITNSNAKYLQYADKLFNINKNTWKKFQLTDSYTINKKTAEFLNYTLFNNEQINSKNNHHHCKVKYIVANSWNSKILIKEINNAIKKYGINDVLLLTPTIQNPNIPIWGIIEKIKNQNNYYIPENDYEYISYKKIKNKICILSYAQAKNIYRKSVFIFNFDMSYYDLIIKNDNQDLTKNIYLATTRATKLLIIIQDFKNQTLNYLNPNNINKYTKLKIDNHHIKEYVFQNQKVKVKNLGIPNGNLTLKNNDELPLNNEYLINNLVNYISNDAIIKLKKAIIITKEKNSNDKNLINWISKIKINHTTYENITEITNEAIIFNYQKIYNPTTKNILDKLNFYLNKNLNWIEINRPLIIEKTNFIFTLNLQEIPPSLNDSLIIAALWNYYITGNDHKLKTISNNSYNWLSYSDLNPIFKQINHQLSNKLLFKHEVFKHNLFNNFNIKLTSYIDCIDLQKNTIWKFVFTNEIDDSQFVEMAFIAYLLNNNENCLFNIIKESIKMKLKSNEIHYTTDLKNINFKFNILNIKTSEVYYLEIDLTKFTKSMIDIFNLNNIYFKHRFFIENNNNIKNLCVK